MTDLTCCDEVSDPLDGGPVWKDSVAGDAHYTGWVIIDYGYSCVGYSDDGRSQIDYCYINVRYCPFCGEALPPVSDD